MSSLDDDRRAHRRVSRYPHTGSGDVTAPALPVTWPPGYRSAGALTFDLDAEAVALSMEPAAIGRMGAISHQSYGPLVGVPRILAMLSRHQVRATFFVPGYTADRYPSVIRAIADAGHEIAHHSYLHEPMTTLTAGEEADMLDLGLRALADAAGVRPTGFRAPMWELNFRTPQLLADRGFLYDSSLMDTEHPYRLIADPGAPEPDTLIELPVSWGLDDWEQYAFIPGIFGCGIIEDPAKALSAWTQELRGIHRYGGLFNHTSHPFLSGRPSRLDALETLLERMLALDGMWVSTLEDIARHIHTLDLQPRAVPEPAVPEQAHWARKPDPDSRGSAPGDGDDLSSSPWKD
ncbi:polysaccharide deacetylase [Rhodococcus cerastii]|nr:polysaccharide deacetylase [Rhodococcus cerastii]